MSSFVDRMFTPPRDHDPLGVHRKGRNVSGSNGVDLGQVVSMLQGLMVAQETMRTELMGEVRGLRARMDNLEIRMSNLEIRMGKLEQEVSAFKADLASAREEVRAYHHTVVGHGILISELEARTSRIEAHLGLPPIG